MWILDIVGLDDIWEYCAKWNKNAERQVNYSDAGRFWKDYCILLFSNFNTIILKLHLGDANWKNWHLLNRSSKLSPSLSLLASQYYQNKQCAAVIFTK